MLQDVNFSSFFDWRNFGVNVLRPINELLERNSHLYVFGKLRLKPIFVTFLGATQYIEDPFLLEKSTDMRWQTTAAIMHAIAATANQNGAASLFVLIPSHYQVNEKQWHIQLAADGLQPEQADRFLPNRKLDSLCQDLHLLDLTTPMLQSNRPLFGQVDAHFNIYGHEFAAKEIADFIRKNNLLSKPKNPTVAIQ